MFLSELFFDTVIIPYSKFCRLICSVAEPHQFHAAPTPGKNFDVAQVPTLPDSRQTFSKSKKISIRVQTFYKCCYMIALQTLSICIEKYKTNTICYMLSKSLSTGFGAGAVGVGAVLCLLVAVYCNKLLVLKLKIF
jgi:hypothetical protein